MKQIQKSYENWGTSRGFHSRSLHDTQEQAFIIAWATHNFEYDWGKRALDELFDPPLSRSTIYELRKKLKGLWETRDSIDSPVDWRDFKAIKQNTFDVEVPFSDLRLMFDQLEKERLAQGNKTSPWRKGGRFVTYRSLAWWSYMAGYYGDEIKEPLDRQIIGDQYAVREMTSQRTGGEFQKEPLDVWLQYKPWASQDNEEEYLEQIHTGIVPKLEWYSFFWQPIGIQGEKKHIRRQYIDSHEIEKVTKPLQPLENSDYLFNFVAYTESVAGIMDMTPKPYLLPSQNLSYMNEAITKLQLPLPEGPEEKIAEPETVYLKDDDFSWYTNTILKRAKYLEKFPDAGS